MRGKKRAKGFYTLSSKASVDQRVLVVLFNGYVTFSPMKYWARVPCRQSRAQQYHRFSAVHFQTSGRIQ